MQIKLKFAAICLLIACVACQAWAASSAISFTYKNVQVAYDAQSKIYFGTAPGNIYVSADSQTGIKSAIDRIGNGQASVQSAAVFTDENNDRVGLHQIAPDYDVKTRKAVISYKLIADNPDTEYVVEIFSVPESKVHRSGAQTLIDPAKYSLTVRGRTPGTVKNGGLISVSVIVPKLPDNENTCYYATLVKASGGMKFMVSETCLPYAPVPEIFYVTKTDTSNPIITGKVRVWTSDEYELLARWRKDYPKPKYLGEEGSHGEINYGKRKGSLEFSVKFTKKVLPGEKYSLAIVASQKRKGGAEVTENYSEYVQFTATKPAPSSLSILCSNAITEDFKVSAERAYAIAKKISQYLPIRPEFLAAISAQETKLGRDMGDYVVGNCDPSNSDDRVNYYTICDKVPIPAAKCRQMPMSANCAIGQVQFIPSTYYKYYESSAALVQKIFGVSTAKYSPFNVCTNFTNAAKYLIALGADGKTNYAENVAACRYWGGDKYQGVSDCDYATEMSPRRACFQKFAKNLAVTKDCYDYFYGWNGE